jgi:DNA-directed RNA polymerase subunit RPC12/RpoP
MTTPIEFMRVTCPQCGHLYETQYRASMNRTINPEFSDEYIEQMSRGTCPRCGFKVALGAIVTEMRGKTLNIWPAPGPKRPRKTSRRRKTDP